MCEGKSKIFQLLQKFPENYLDKLGWQKKQRQH